VKERKYEVLAEIRGKRDTYKRRVIDSQLLRLGQVKEEEQVQEEKKKKRKTTA
jgi:hypothetical protein